LDALQIRVLQDPFVTLPTLASRDAFLDVPLDLQCNAWLTHAPSPIHQIAQQLPSALLLTAEDATEDSSMQMEPKLALKSVLLTCVDLNQLLLLSLALMDRLEETLENAKEILQDAVLGYFEIALIHVLEPLPIPLLLHALFTAHTDMTLK